MTEDAQQWARRQMNVLARRAEVQGLGICEHVWVERGGPGDEYRECDRCGKEWDA